MPQRWLILGSGGHARSVADAIRAQGDAVLGFFDDSRPSGELVAGIPVLGPLRLAWDGAPTPERFVVAIGNPVLRQRWQRVLQGAGAPVGLAVHPRACVSPSAQLAPGCVVLAGAVINAEARLEPGVLVNQRRRCRSRRHLRPLQQGGRQRGHGRRVMPRAAGFPGSRRGARLR